MPSPYLEVFRSPRLAVVLVFGFASGLPLALTGSTLQAWLAVSGVDIQTIAWFSWIGIPYLLKGEPSPWVAFASASRDIVRRAAPAGFDRP